MDVIPAIAIALGVVALIWGLRYGSALRQRSFKAQKKAALLEAEIASLQADHTDILGQSQQLQAQLDQLSGENLTLRQAVDRLQSLAIAGDDLAQVRAALAEQNAALDRLNQDIAQRQASIREIRTTEERLQVRQADLHQALHTLDHQKTSLHRSIYSLQQQIQKLQADHQALELTYLTLDDRCGQLRQEVERYEQEKQDLGLQTQNLRAYLDLLKQENRALEAQHDKLQDRDQRLESHAGLLKQQDELLQTITDLETENVQLSDQLSQAQAQVEQELQGLRRIKIVSACRQHSTSDHELFHAQITMNFSRVREALDFAEMMFGHVLEVWESARVSADICNFIRPDDAYRSLQSLAWFGDYYFERDGDIGNNLYPFLRERYNLICTPESDTVKNNRKLRDERYFWHSNNQRKEMLDHLKIGGGTGMNSILRIYFALNRESRKIEIGHCGKHLST